MGCFRASHQKSHMTSLLTSTNKLLPCQGLCHQVNFLGGGWYRGILAAQSSPYSDSGGTKSTCMVWWGSWKLGGLKLQKSHICPFFSLDHFDKWKFHITKSFQQQKYWIVQLLTCFQTGRLVTKAFKQLEGTTAGVTLFGGIGGRRGRRGQVTITSLLTRQPGQVLGDPCVHKCFSTIVAGCSQSTVCCSWGLGN